MPRRYNITQGAKTTANGIVSTTQQFSKTNGAPLALEGDPVDCPTCHTTGRIKCVGPRLHSAFTGKQFALSDDLCICNCDPSPKLVAIQQHMFQSVDE